MPQDQSNHGLNLGVFGRRTIRRGLSGTEVTAAVLSGVWIIACVIFFLVLGKGLTGSGIANFMTTILAVFLPVAVIWLAVSSARSARIMREETVRLQSTIDAMRHSYLTQAQATPVTIDPHVEEKIARLEEAQKQTEQAVATFSSTRSLVRNETPLPPVLPPPAEAQASLALEPQASDSIPPLTRDEMIRALHFPETAEDEEGFRALRRALKDRKVAKLVQASQDVLTLLSQDGIYMDDLRPDKARPEIWRHFAEGHRGREVAALGGIRDRSSLALTAGRMKNDPVFRDAAHHFLRQFDRVFAEFEEQATDEEVVRLSDTRTARAFMLLGRVTGTFS